MALDGRQHRALEWMGITRWRRRTDFSATAPVATPPQIAGEVPVTEAPPAAQAPPTRPSVFAGDPHPAPAPDMISFDAMDWHALRACVAACERCELHRSRTNTVFGVGDPAADWLFVGEAPGAQEDRQGEPFVGRAGQLLNSMLRATGRRREDVYIANVLKCRPPNNRDPSAAEAAECLPFLRRQIALIEPRVIIALGRIAAQRLLGLEIPLARLRGKVHRWQTASGEVPLIVTYHPAYLLRSPQDKRKAWEDLRLVMKVSA